MSATLLSTDDIYRYSVIPTLICSMTPSERGSVKRTWRQLQQRRCSIACGAGGISGSWRRLVAASRAAACAIYHVCIISQYSEVILMSLNGWCIMTQWHYLHCCWYRKWRYLPHCYLTIVVVPVRCDGLSMLLAEWRCRADHLLSLEAILISGFVDIVLLWRRLCWCLSAFVWPLPAGLYDAGIIVTFVESCYSVCVSLDVFWRYVVLLLIRCLFTIRRVQATVRPDVVVIERWCGSGWCRWQVRCAPDDLIIAGNTFVVVLVLIIRCSMTFIALLIHCWR